MKQILHLLLIVQVFFSCGTIKESKQATIPEDDTHLVISYRQTSGLSEVAPVYKIELYSNYQMYLTATKNLDKEGKFLRTISEKEYNHVINAFEKAGFFEFDDEYTSSSTDLPTRHLYFKHDGNEKEIKDYDNAPESLKELEYLMQSFLDRVGWEKMSW